MRKITLFIMALLAICSSCRKEPKLIIIHTNDTHSHFEALRSGDLTGHGGVIERAAFIDSVRLAEGADRVLLLHGGDFGQGTSYFSELGGELEIDVINAMKYDVVALGNHEFDNNIEALTERLKRLEGTKVVCANVDLEPFELGQYVTPYAIVERGGMKIGVIGMESDLSSNVSKIVSSRMQQLDDVTVINKWTGYLHDTEKCDLIILLSHMGIKTDSEVIPQTHLVDLVIGAHSHTFMEDIEYLVDADGRKVPMISDGCWGLEMGKVTVY